MASDPGAPDMPGGPSVLPPTTSTTSLTHLSYLCPGLHDKDSRQDIRRKTFRDLFTENQGRLVIPLFQRRYCWTEKTVWHWFEDVVRGKRDHLGIHNSGNLIIKKMDTGEVVIIDGQQRVTTTMLLLAALRDKLMSQIIEDSCINIDIDSSKKCLNDIESLLFVSKDVDLTLGKNLKDGEDFLPSRLLPSFCDRKSFFHLCCDTMESTSTFQSRAKNVLRNRIEEEISRKSASEKVEWLVHTTNHSIEKMGITQVDILSDINMAQVFLWLQEKSLFGEAAAAILNNPTPGIFFTCVDLVRNLLLSPTMNKTIQEQEQFYRQHWLMDIERTFTDQEQFHQTFRQFVESKKIEHKSSFETGAEAVIKGPTTSSQGKDYIYTYGKFTSLFEQVAAEKAKKANPNVENPTATEQDLLETSLFIIKEIVTFIGRKNLSEIVKKETW